MKVVHYSTRGSTVAVCGANQGKRLRSRILVKSDDRGGVTCKKCLAFLKLPDIVGAAGTAGALNTLTGVVGEAVVAYELRADEDIDAPVTVWRGGAVPTQAQIDRVAGAACRRGWNGTSLDLYADGKWVEWVYPSEGVLA